MENNKERFKYLVEALRHKSDALKEEYDKLNEQLKDVKENGNTYDVVLLEQRLIDNLDNRLALAEEYAQAVKEYLEGN